MTIQIKEVTNKKELKDFIKFPFELYKDSEFWVPPIINEELKNFDTNINPAFKFCKAKFWLAYKDNKICGRIAAVINTRYNEKTARNLMRFGWIDFYDDKNISKALLEQVEVWAKKMNMDEIEGPLGFTDFDPEGMLIEGFNKLSTVSGIYNYPYYSEHMESLGFVKGVDWLEFQMVPPNPLNEKVQKISEIILQRYNLKLFNAKTKNDLMPLASEIFDVLNNAYKDLHGFVSLTEEQKEYYKNMYFNYIDPKYVPVILDKDDKIAGFCITMPSISIALQKAKGKLFPFGFLHLIKAIKSPSILDLYLIAVRDDMRDKGLVAVMMTQINKVTIEKGIQLVESNYELEDNKRIQNQWKYYERKQHKRRRSYLKKI